MLCEVVSVPFLAALVVGLLILAATITATTIIDRVQKKREKYSLLLCLFVYYFAIIIIIGGAQVAYAWVHFCERILGTGYWCLATVSPTKWSSIFHCCGTDQYLRLFLHDSLVVSWLLLSAIKVHVPSCTVFGTSWERAVPLEEYKTLWGKHKPIHAWPCTFIWRTTMTKVKTYIKY